MKKKIKIKKTKLNECGGVPGESCGYDWYGDGRASSRSHTEHNITNKHKVGRTCPECCAQIYECACNINDNIAKISQIVNTKRIPPAILKLLTEINQNLTEYIKIYNEA